MAKQTDFVAQVRELVPAKRQKTWIDRLDAANAERLKAAGDAWVKGELGKYQRPVAVAIAKRLQEYGVTISECSVREWLAKLKRS
jgi:hypothetical protein